MPDVNVGDKVIIEATVVSHNDEKSWIRILTSDSSVPHAVPTRFITKIVSPPKVGDIVWWDADPSIKLHAAPYYGCTLRYVHQADGDLRKWGVVAFQGDIPQSVYFDRLRKTREACAD